jgi:membrane fusion protein, adhesin transport system
MKSASFKSAELVSSAPRSRAVARWLGIGSVVALVLCLLVPWQQNITGSGRVIAWAPSERRQPIEAPVNGRVVHWRVREGAFVREGDTLVEILDNDPQLVERLATERDAVSSKLENYEHRARALDLVGERARAAHGAARSRRPAASCAPPRRSCARPSRSWRPPRPPSRRRRCSTGA